MVDATTSQRNSLAAILRNATISMLLGVVLFFLMFIGRQELWSLRLALYGAVGALLTYGFSHFLDVAVGDRIRRRKLVSDKLVGVPLYFVAGCAAFAVTTGLMHAAQLMPFSMTTRDMWMTLVISGAVSIVVGLLFYSFHVMGESLRQSIEQLKEQEFSQKELELARAIQMRLLPPEQLVGDGYRVDARNLAAHFVAGDFYDVFRLADGRVGLVVADVSGKGMGASLIMASVKAVLPFVADGRDAAATLTELNRKLHEELAAREFVALAYACFDPRTGTLELANAGLPDPYLLRHDEITEPLCVPGPRVPLAALGDISYESLTFALRPADRLLMLTDGLPEAPTASGEPLGYDALARLVSTAASTPGNLINLLFASVSNASQPGLEDDWTALVLQALPMHADGQRR